MDEAKGTYKNNTKLIWQIKHVSRSKYRDNVDSDILGGINKFKKYVEGQNTKNLDTRIIKRTVKEDVI